MANRLAHLLFLCFVPIAGMTQQPETPIWEMRFYIEDAAGHKDTLEVVVVQNASTDLDPEWDEQAAPLPLNATFDAVLVADRFDVFPAPIYQKRAIVGANYIPPPNCFSVEASVGIYIHAIHQPVTIKWDRVLFNSERCLRSSLISNNYGDDVVTLWDWYNPMMPDNTFWCLASEDSLVVETTTEVYEDVFFPVSSPVEIEGLGEQTIYGVKLLISRYPFWPCVNIVSTGEEEEEAPLLALAPNPAREEVQLEWPSYYKARTLAVWGSDGQLHRHYVVAEGTHAFTLPVSPLPAGMYWLLLWDEQGNILRKSFIKQ